MMSLGFLEVDSALICHHSSQTHPTVQSTGDRPGLESDIRWLKDTRHGFKGIYVQFNILAPSEKMESIL